MTRGLDHLRDTAVHLLLGLGVVGVVMVMAADWEAPGPSQAKLEDPEHIRTCAVCQHTLQGPGVHPSRAMDDMVALQDGSQAWHSENARVPGGQADCRAFRDAVPTVPDP
jgi:hypothetical protein